MSSDALYVFGDQSLGLLSSTQQLSRQCRQNPPLGDFMRVATDVIQHAISTIPGHLRPTVLRFDTPLQLAELIENDSSALSAAAVASSRNLTELLQIAPHVVALSFYIGYEAQRRSDAVESSSGAWATIVSDVQIEDVQPVIDKFNQRMKDCRHRKVYISAVGKNSVTIGGPPSTVQKLWNEAPTLLAKKKVELSIKAAFHAEHLTPISYTKIFEHVDRRNFRRRIHHLIISPYSGGFNSSSKLEDVLHEIVDEILQRPINWKTVTSNLPQILSPTACAMTFGPFVATAAFSTWLPSKDCKTRQHDRGADATNNGSSLRREGSGAVAIVGMSIRCPGGETLEEFWDVLKEGRDMHQQIPADRFDIEAYHDPSGRAKNTMTTPYGVFLDRPGYFDPRFFNMSPRETLQTDPQQRLMLLTAYEALENAGYAPNRTTSSNTRRIASFIGQTGDDYREANASQDIDTYFITGNIRAFGPGRLNYHFGWEGPSFSIDTACSSSSASIQLACSALLARECDTAVSGGANLLTTPDLFAGLSRGGFLSQTGGCKTFDQDADGYVRGEACGVVVLKRLEDALADRDNVLATIRGATTNHSAEAISITHPHEKTQERLFTTVLNNANIEPTEIDLAEIHGTGTQAGDTVESRSVTNVLCKGRSHDNPLLLSSVKPNVGHGEAASGVTSVIKAVLMMQKNMVPPHIGIKGMINEKLPPFGDLHAIVCSEPTPFLPRTRGDGKRKILVNNFDAAGGNTSLVLEDPPLLRRQGQDERSHKVVVLSAKSERALSGNTCRLLNWLRDHPEIRVEDVAYTTTARRMHYPFRRAYATNSIKELTKLLEADVLDQPTHRPQRQRSIVFCFTGQGSEYASMASGLYNTHPQFREHIKEYASICQAHGFPSFLPVLEDHSAALRSPLQVQLAIIAIELGLAFLWKSWGVCPTAVVGHSLGEYAALCYAGAISVSDCFYLVGKRASLIASRCSSGTHAMLAFKAPTSVIRDHLITLDDPSIEFACFNGPKSSVLSGPLASIERLNTLAKSNNLSTKILSMRHAFHSSQLDIILDDFEKIASEVNYEQLSIPLASTLLGKIIAAHDAVGPDYLRRQAREPVQFEHAIMALRNASLVDESTAWIELGPASACLNMVNSIRPHKLLLSSLRKHQQDWQTLSSSLSQAYTAGLDVNWVEFHRPFEMNLQLLQLPNYCFDLKNYWIYGSRPNPSTNKQQTTIQETYPSHDSSFCPTDCLHYIDRDESNDDLLRITFAANTSNPVLKKALCGHMVNGIAICPSSVYADMAFAVGVHIGKLSKLHQSVSIEIDQLKITRPLIISHKDTGQVIRVMATKQRSSNEVQLEYGSQQGSLYQTCATCIVRFINKESSPSELSNASRLIGARIDQLRVAASEGRANRLLKPMVYKLFKGLVDYSQEYQGLEEVFLDTSTLEATADVKLRSVDGNFACNPYWIDGIAHLSGFILNGSDFTPDDAVFISHGWESLKIFEPLSHIPKYRSYVHMRPNEHQSIFTGDLYLYNGARIAAVCRGLGFRRLRRDVLDHVIPSALHNSHDPRDAVIQRSHILHPMHLETVPLTSMQEPHTPTEQANVHADLRSVSDLIAGELGLNPSDLDEETDLMDLGFDSLMTTSVLTRLKTELQMRLPASTFVECRSIKELRSYLITHAYCSVASTGFELNKPEAERRNQNAVTTVTAAAADQSQVQMVQILEAIAHELTVDASELKPEVQFTDLGMDSLLALSILSSLKGLVNEHLPASLFIQCPKVADLCLYFDSSVRSQTSRRVNQGSFDYNRTNDSEVEQIATRPSTSATRSEGFNREVSLSDVNNTAALLRKLIAEATSICVGDIEANVPLAELGVDSLLASSILTRVQEHTGINLTSAFLSRCSTISTIEQALLNPPWCTGMDPTKPFSLASLSPSALFSTNVATQDNATNKWTASSILLQESHSHNEPCLFLIPDGSGSPSSYLGLPALSQGGAVYALSSPFLDHESSFKISLQDLVSLYVDEIIRIQPRGPYRIGGWSIGGICAFEAASQLIQEYGQEISCLVLIDAPCPTVLPPLPVEDIDFLQSIGVFDTLRSDSKLQGNTSIASTALGLRDGTRDHFVGSLNALAQYNARAIDGPTAPKSVVILWADHGVWQTLGEEIGTFAAGTSTKNCHPTTRWLMNPRHSYGTCGWEELLPQSNFTCHPVQGDHFSMMRKPGVLDLGAKISLLLPEH